MITMIITIKIKKILITIKILKNILKKEKIPKMTINNIDSNKPYTNQKNN